MEKLTNREMLNLIKEKLSANEKVVAWVDHPIELLDKKNAMNSAKAKEVKEKDLEVVNAVIEVLKSQDKLMTITEILAIPEVAEMRVLNDKKELVALTNQKLTYLLNHNDNIEKVIDKKKSYFRVK